MKRYAVFFGLLILALLFVGPLLGLAIGTGSNWPALSSLFTTRKLLLLGRSVGLALIVCGGVLLLSYFIAYGFFTFNPPSMVFPGLMLLMLFVPPYIHAQSFIFLFDNLFLGTAINFNGFWATVLCLCFALLPLPSILLYECMRAIPRPLLDSARVYRRPFIAFLRVFFPLSLKGVLGAAVVVFVLCFSEFTVPSIFGINTYALDIFAEYATSHSAAKTFFHALPALIFCLLFALPASRFLQGLILSPPSPKLLTPRKTPSAWFVLSCFLLAIAVLLPMFNLFAKWGGPIVFVKNLASSTKEIYSSLILALLTLLAAFPIALLGGVLIAKAPQRASRFAVIITLLPIALPAGVTGIACVHLLKTFNLTGTLAAPVLAGALRMAPLGALTLAGFLAGIDNTLFSAWRLYRQNHTQGFARVLFVLARPGILASACLIFAQTLADVGTVLLTVPPGMNTITIKIYNYLHYGASDVVASLCLLMLAITVVVAAPVWHMLTCKKKKTERTENSNG